MTKYTVSVPIIGYITTTIEVDDSECTDASEVLEGIEKDEIEVPLDESMIDSWYPVLDLNTCDFGMYDMPSELEVC